MVTIDTNTVGTAGDYATLELWETGEAADLVAGDIIARAALLDETHTSTLILNSGTWNTDATRFIWIDANTGTGHDGTAGSGARVVDGAGTHPIRISVAEHVHITNLELTTSSAAASQAGLFIFSADNSTITLERMIIHGFDAVNGRGIDLSNVTGCVVTVLDSCIYDIERAGIDMEGTNNVQTVNVYNCVFHNCGFLSSANDGGIITQAHGTGTKTIDLRNSLVHSSGSLSVSVNGTADPSYWAAGTGNNILSDAQGTAELVPGDLIESASFQAGDGGSGTRVMFVNVTAGSEDYHLFVPEDVGANAASGFGANLSALSLPASTSLGDDVDGILRHATEAWDAGWHRLAAGTALQLSGNSIGNFDFFGMVDETVPATEAVELDCQQTLTKCRLGVRLQNGGGATITDSAGTLKIERKTPNSEIWEPVNGSPFAATLQLPTLAWDGNTSAVRITPQLLTDAVTYQAILTCNKN